MGNFHKYLNITPEEEKWGFYVTTVGYSRIAPHQVYPNNMAHPTEHSFTWDKGRILDGYYIVYIPKGEGLFETNLTAPYAVKEGTCFFLFPGVWHRYRPDFASGWEEYWIGFKGKYPEGLVENKFFQAAAPVISTGYDDYLLSLFQQVIDVVRTGRVGYNQVAASITSQVLAAIYRISQEQVESGDPKIDFINEAKFLLRESLEEKVNMQHLIKRIPMSYSSFSKIFKETTGESPNQYHLHLRLAKAKDLLISTRLKIDEIAGQTGFTSIHYFSKIFKKKQGISPTAFRLKNIK
jgi:AraC-like DNA-binding protein